VGDAVWGHTAYRGSRRGFMGRVKSGVERGGGGEWGGIRIKIKIRSRRGWEGELGVLRGGGGWGRGPEGCGLGFERLGVEVF